MNGAALYERLLPIRHDLAEAHRVLAYDLSRLWRSNDHQAARLVAAYRIASAALVAEMLALVALVSDRLF